MLQKNYLILEQKVLAWITKTLNPIRMRYPWFMGAAVWLGWLSSCLFGKHNQDIFGQVFGTDFIEFYAAGKVLLTGQTAALYNLEVAHSIQLSIYPGAVQYINLYLNPPFYAFLFIPFAALPYILSAILWMVLSLFWLWLSFRLLHASQPNQTFAWALTCYPVFAGISFGQNSFFSLLLFSLVYTLIKRKRFLAAGLVSSLLLFKPQLLFGLGFFWLLEWRKYWKAMAGIALGGAALTGLSFGLLPEASLDYFNYTRALLPNLVSLQGFPYWNANSVQAFWITLFPGQNGAANLLYLLGIGAGILIYLRVWQRYREQLTIMYACTICLTVWIAPHIMIYDWCLLLIASVLFWEGLPEFRQQWRALYALVWTVTFISGPLTFVQLKFLPFAIQISLPVLAFSLVAAYHILTGKYSADGKLESIQ